MRNLLFISHRIPFPPDKGEKIRGWNLLNHLSRSFRVHLGCIIDDPADWRHMPAVQAVCASAEGFGIDKRRQKLRALARVRPGRPLMLDYYGSPALQRWVDRTMAAERMDVVYVYSTAMAPYVERHRQPGTVLDMQDIDSEKWGTYADEAGFPMRHVWRREGRTLLAYERRAALAADLTLLVTEAEVRRFAELAPESRDKVTWLEQGVDLRTFDPALPFDNPYGTPGPHVVFTGNMDYWPNADAATFFARDVMPSLRERGAQFHVVGANPGAEVLALAGQADVHVTGRVPDVRPYVAHADVSVAPLRIARGVQNKVLEAMALGRPTVISPGAAAGVRAEAGREVLVAGTAAEFAAAVGEVLDGKHPGLGAAARGAAVERYSWEATLARLDTLLARVAPG